MKTTTFAFAALTLIAAPAFADDMMDVSKLTCAEFAAMDSEGMMKTIDMMHKAGPDAAMAMDEAAMKMAGEHVMMGCVGKPDMMAMDAMMAKM